MYQRVQCVYTIYYIHRYRHAHASGTSPPEPQIRPGHGLLEDIFRGQSVDVLSERHAMQNQEQMPTSPNFQSSALLGFPELVFLDSRFPGKSMEHKHLKI